MADILSAFAQWVGMLFSTEIVEGLTFGSFLLLMLILAGVGLILRTFWGGNQ